MAWVKGHYRNGKWVGGHYRLPRGLGFLSRVPVEPVAPQAPQPGQQAPAQWATAQQQAPTPMVSWRGLGVASLFALAVMAGAVCLGSLAAQGGGDSRPAAQEPSATPDAAAERREPSRRRSHRRHRRSVFDAGKPEDEVR